MTLKHAYLLGIYSGAFPLGSCSVCPTFPSYFSHVRTVVFLTGYVSSVPARSPRPESSEGPTHRRSNPQ